MPLTASPVRDSRPFMAPLLRRLAQKLEHERVPYCQWKGHRKEARWGSGAGDVDLLVDSASRPVFVALLGQLGFKLALAPEAWQVPGIESWLGHEPLTAGLIHVHVHYRLILGSPWQTTYQLPLVQPCLAGVQRRAVLPVPAPELELTILAIRGLLRFRLRDAWRMTPPAWLRDIQQDLARLGQRPNFDRLATILARHIPTLDIAFIERCAAVLQPEASPWRRLAVRRELRQRLADYA